MGVSISKIFTPSVGSYCEYEFSDMSAIRFEIDVFPDFLKMKNL